MSKEQFYIGIPTKNLSANVPTIVKVIFASFIMGKSPSMTVSDSSTVCMARSSICNEIKLKSSNSDLERVLWLDSDIFIDNSPEELATIFLEADKHRRNIVGFYNLADKRGSMTAFDDTNIDFAKFRELEQFTSVKFAGLGFYYGDTPLNYRFHESYNAGEDFNFFIDNKIEIVVDKRIILHHNKNMFI